MSTHDDVSAAKFKIWLISRIKQANRDAIDNLAKRIIADNRLPWQGSRSLYLARLKSKGYSAEDIATFEQAWREMRDTQS
jgi:hypothetical protein